MSESPTHPADTPAADTAARPSVRLKQAPDWHYLLRETYELYRFSSSGGSDRIRTHMRRVRETISRLVKSDPEMRLAGGIAKPVTGHLSRALDEGRGYPLAPVARAVDHVRGDLQWQYGYDRVPRGLADRYAFAEIAGPRGPVLSPDVILGLVLFAPGCVYPAHAHHGITESYICLSGAVSENHLGVFGPGSLIFNPPQHMHRITVSANEPSLLLYAWIGERDDLANQKMVLGGPPKRG